MVKTVQSLVIGAGQAGIAASEHLSRNKISHLVLEKDRVAEAWRSGRWDSLKANGPAWHDRFPNMTFQHCAPDGFAAKEEVADYLENYAEMIDAPIRTGVEVLALKRITDQTGFEVTTSDGVILAETVVCATGAFQTPVIPSLVPESEPITQLHSARYRNPDQLPEGAVLIVGSGSSGGQIADELCRSGRKVFLSIGPHDRPPRAYRGRDYCWWLGVLGLWDLAAKEPGTEHLTISVSGANGGRTVDFRRLAHEGITLLGRTTGFAEGRLEVADDLQANIAAGDANYLDMLDQADAYVAKFGLDLPPEPAARQMLPNPASLTDPIRILDLKAEEISTILWATGYAQDFSWMQVDAFDDAGAPIHQRGVSKEPGLYFLGLPWQSRRGSTFIWGVWHDAAYVADQIAIQGNYRNYQPAAAW
ncbi:MAG: NAD(P)/FAD-dependent oxidoreductase [Pseudomonadota bacterium]